MEFAGPAPLGPSAALAAEMPLRKPRDVKQIEPGGRAGNTAPDTGKDRDNGPEAQAARDVAALRREAERRDLPVGPTPAFEVSQLEMEADLQHVIARVEAARSQARDAGALKAEAEAEARLAEADYDKLADAGTAGTVAGPATGLGTGEDRSSPHSSAADGVSTRAPRTPSLDALY